VPNDTRPGPRRRQNAGLSRATLLAVLGAAAVGAGVVAVVYLRGDPPPAQTAPRDTAHEEMVALQEDFKRYVENRLDFIDLLPDAKAYTRRHPDAVAGHILLAQVLMKLELYGEAYPSLSRALELENRGGNFELLKLTGTCAAKLGVWGEAERHLLAADALRPDDITVVLQLGNVYFQTGRLEDAEESYQHALNANRTTPPHKAYAGLAEICAARGQYDEAQPFINRAIRWANEDGEAQAWVYQLKKVRILFDAGQWAAGESLLISTQGESPEATYTLPCTRLRARLHGHHGEPLRAARDYELLISGVVDTATFTDAERAEIYAELAHWHLEAGNPDRAGEAVAELRRLVPGDPRLAALEARLRGG
jgi:tetratricopeptide (TPR) repeat protein